MSSQLVTLSGFRMCFSVAHGPERWHLTEAERRAGGQRSEEGTEGGEKSVILKCETKKKQQNKLSLPPLRKRAQVQTVATFVAATAFTCIECSYAAWKPAF